MKKNPLKNKNVMLRLNPYAAVQKKTARLVEEARKKEKQARLDQKRGVCTFVKIGSWAPWAVVRACHACMQCSFIYVRSLVLKMCLLHCFETGLGISEEDVRVVDAGKFRCGTVPVIAVQVRMFRNLTAV